MDIVGIDHTENVEDIKDRVPDSEYDTLYHEDFTRKQNVNKINLLKKLLMAPIYAFSFFFLVPLRVLRRQIGKNRKSDFTFREESSIPEKISIDAYPTKIVEMHKPSNQEIAFNWAPIILGILGVFSLLRLGLTANLIRKNLIIYTVISAAFLIIFLSQIVLSWFLSLEERDKYMTKRILRKRSEENDELVIVGDAHAPGIYSALCKELEENVNLYRVRNPES